MLVNWENNSNFACANPKSLMILFDCERMKRPYSGKAVFCRQLAPELIAVSGEYPWKFGLYLPKQAWKFCKGVPRVRQHRFHEKIFAVARKIELFHACTPLSGCRPHNGRSKILTTIHDLNYIHFNTGPAEYAWHDERTARAIRESDRIATISESAKADILEHFGDPGKPIDVIYNGLDRYTGKTEVPAQVPEGDFLYCVCRITKSKNLQTLPALLVGNDLRLVISGRDMGDGHLQEIQSQAARLGVSERLILTGPLSDAQVHWYLSHCKAFVFPSLCEGFGLPVLEAMQYYKPVFCSGIPALREVGGVFACYFNEGFDPDAMREELYRGLSESASKDNRRETDEWLAKFSWHAAAEQYYDIYSRML